MDELLRALLALVAVSNVLPILPVIQEYTRALPDAEARAYGLRALVGGNIVGIAFMFASPHVFAALSLTLADLRIGGGVILLAYATHDILFSRVRSSRRQITETDSELADHELGAPIAPLGVPIMVGPATLSMLVVLTEVHGTAIVSAALGINFVVNAVLIFAAHRLSRVLGEGVSRAVGKVMSLLLASLGAGMLRMGISATLNI